jgi:chorismate mutase
MTSDTIIDLWPALDELRRTSRLVLIALEADDLDRVQTLAARSQELASTVENGLKDHPSSPKLATILRELHAMNDRIVTVLAERRAEAAQAVAETRRQRFRVVASRPQRSEDAGFVNQRR